VKIEYELGVTLHSQRLTLTADKTGTTTTYQITKHAGGQLDDTVILFGLTDDVLDMLAKAVKITREIKA